MHRPTWSVSSDTVSAWPPNGREHVAESSPAARDQGGLFSPDLYRDPRDPFATPYASGNPSRAVSTSALSYHSLNQRYFHTRRIKATQIQKPWLSKKDPRAKFATIIPALGLLIGLGLAGFIVYIGIQTVVINQYCSVYEDDFSSGFNPSIWTKEAEVGGFGNGQFEETTTTDENVFVKNGMLYIKPSLQDSKLIEANNVINLTKSGICTGEGWFSCVTSTNTTNGTIVNPVKSGRISTKPRSNTKGASIKYGRIEVEAQLAKGDWLWPAIWLLPVHNVYGEWPASGEIDIAESRGNNYTYPLGGNNFISSALHWGPDSTDDAWWRTIARKNALHTTFAEKFHLFGLEWSEKYIFTYIDNRLRQVLYTSFNQPLWPKGDFPLSNENGTAFVDPWSQTGRDNTPFDEDFYLILNVAVGGTNGWFEDGKNGKPWVDASPTARKDFWDARDEWFPTWQSGGGEMVVKSVKMWQQKGYNGCGANAQTL